MSKFKYDFKLGNQAFNITGLFRYHIMRLQGRYDYPKPAWHYPLDGWTDKPKDIMQAIVDDGGTVRPQKRNKS